MINYRLCTENQVSLTTIKVGRLESDGHLVRDDRRIKKNTSGETR
jgi:hypothetical protein